MRNSFSHLLTFLTLFCLLFAHPTIASPSRPTVGAILPLTGVAASWGEGVRQGLEAGIGSEEERFSILFEDEGSCEAAKAVAAYRKLVSQDRASVIFVGCLSGTKAIAPLAKRDSVLLLSLGLLDEEVLSTGAKLVNLATEVGREGQYLSSYLLREPAKKIAGIFFGDAFGNEVAKTLSNELVKGGKSLVSREIADPNTRTFRPLILRWKQRGVQLLVTTLPDKQSAILFRELSELEFRPLVYSSYVLESVVPTVADRSLFEGTRYTHPVNEAEGSPEYLKARAEIEKRGTDGNRGNINSFFAYDGVRLLGAGIGHCHGLKSECLFRHFTTLGEHYGVSGKMTFMPTGAMNRPYGLKMVRGGVFEWVNR